MKKNITLLFLLININLFGQGIQLNLSQQVVNLSAGQSIQVNISLTPTGGFNQQITLSSSCNGCSGFGFTFNPNPIFYPYTNGVTMTFSVASGVASGTYLFVIQGANGPTSAQDTLHVNVIANSCDFSHVGHLSLPFTSLLVNSNGVWAGGSGLVKFVGTNFTEYNTTNSQIPGGTTDLAEDSQHNIWMTTYNGIAKFDGIYWTIYNDVNSGLIVNDFNTIAIDSNDVVWATTYEGGGHHGSGIYRFDGTNWNLFDTLNTSLPSNSMEHVTFDRNGLLWVYVWNYSLQQYELYNYDGTNWILRQYPHQCFPLIYVNEIDFDLQNNAWFGIVDNHLINGDQWGLVKLSASQFEIWADSSLLTFNHQIFDFNCNVLYADTTSPIGSQGIYSVYVDHLNNVWAGSIDNLFTGRGVYKYDGNSFTVYNKQNSQLSDNFILSITEYNDTIYILNARGFGEPSMDIDAYSCLNIGIEKIKNENEIIFYPNPTSGVISFLNTSASSIFKVYDLSGKLLNQIHVEDGTRSIQLDNLADGYYIYVLEEKEMRKSGKLILLRE